MKNFPFLTDLRQISFNFETLRQTIFFFTQMQVNFVIIEFEFCLFHCLIMQFGNFTKFLPKRKIEVNFIFSEVSTPCSPCKRFSFS